ncbi:enterochelin esterase [Streptomyces sp. NPDC048172]|uniref:enterochelin esterase n=1 Tax=Streptomyces sp. NPDC048172 TaxID=3365505 RepID=UPI00371A733E
MQNPLSALREAVRAGVPGAERDFWLRVEATGTPLVAPDPQGDPAHREVTFLWRGEAAAVVTLLHTVTDKDRHAGDLTPHAMERIPGTEVWALTYRLRADHRASYQFSVCADGVPGTHREAWLRVLDEALPDPFNPHPHLPARDGRHPASVLALEDAPPQPYVARRPGVRRGRVVRHEIDGRGVTAHVPPAAPGPYAVAVLLDGEMWGPVLEVGDTLDNLHAEGALPPTLTLLVDTMATRREDLSCSAQFTDWLADTLLPFAARTYGVEPGPSRTLIAGQSAGGLTTAYAAHRRPDAFGLALSQSGSFWWPDEDPEWLTRQYETAPRRAVRLYLEVGHQEWMLLEENRRLRDVLRARGYEVTYAEFNGGHDYACWRGGLATGLVSLLGPPTG